MTAAWLLNASQIYRLPQTRTNTHNINRTCVLYNVLEVKILLSQAISDFADFSFLRQYAAPIHLICRGNQSKPHRAMVSSRQCVMPEKLIYSRIVLVPKLAIDDTS
jgi:hypothetical protein